MNAPNTTRRRLLAGAVGLAVATACRGAAAQEAYPAPGRLVKIIVPYTPGTGADILSRLLGPKLGERWKTSFVTENRPGASSTLGAALVANAAPDGYTFLFTATSFGTSAVVEKNVPYNPVKDFTPVSLIATSAVSLLVADNVPVKTVAEFISYVKKQPGKLNYSSPGSGTPQHLAMELFKLETGIDIVHVPYKASGGATTDLIGGHVQAMMVPLQTGAPYVAAGQVKMLAVTTDERSPAFPDVPTMKELGFPKLVVYTWYGALAPPNTPARFVEKLNSDINALLQEPDIREALAKQGMTPGGGPPERMGNLLREELARWARVVANAGIKAD
ncbi:MAG TPA: tripartite tricarboxylate transporter substrate binding protein [Alphaproteobacteria bacterium]